MSKEKDVLISFPKITKTRLAEWSQFSVSREGEYLCDSRMSEVTSNNHRKFTFTLRLLFTHKNV